VCAHWSGFLLVIFGASRLVPVGLVGTRQKQKQKTFLVFFQVRFSRTLRFPHPLRWKTRHPRPTATSKSRYTTLSSLSSSLYGMQSRTMKVKVQLQCTAQINTPDGRKGNEAIYASNGRPKPPQPSKATSNDPAVAITCCICETISSQDWVGRVTGSQARTKLTVDVKESMGRQDEGAPVTFTLAHIYGTNKRIDN
jgi:hypothetical protein